MIAIISFILWVITRHMGENFEIVTVIPAKPAYMPDSYAPELDEETEWDLYKLEAYYDYCDEFDAIFNAVEFKRAKNGRSMVKGINDKSFKFCKKA